MWNVYSMAYYCITKGDSTVLPSVFPLLVKWSSHRCVCVRTTQMSNQRIKMNKCLDEHTDIHKKNWLSMWQEHSLLTTGQTHYIYVLESQLSRWIVNEKSFLIQYDGLFFIISLFFLLLMWSIVQCFLLD